MTERLASLKRVRLVALLEGVSFATLLFIAMPLKYVWGIPMFTRIVGTAHGALTLWFMLTLARAVFDSGWPWRRALLAFAASLVPLGAFVFDVSLQREIAALLTRKTK